MAGPPNSCGRQRPGAKRRNTSFVTAITSMARCFQTLPRARASRYSRRRFEHRRRTYRRYARFCERFIGSLKRECLDHMLILHFYQLHCTVRLYVDYYNRSRPHQGIGQRVPVWYHRDYPPSSGQIIATPVLGGLHHAYSRAADGLSSQHRGVGTGALLGGLLLAAVHSIVQ